jgi:cyclophilin family peptidyl-prolyl cis-trans isomerase
VAPNAAPTVIDLKLNFSDPDSPDTNEGETIVRIDTNFGPIDIQLYDLDTPETVANFLSYVNSDRFVDTIFHRSVKNFVIQAGGFVFSEDTGSVDEIVTDPPVVNEPGISNTRGTIAMAKLGDQPDSATSQFFFNLSDSNASNLDNQNGGFTVFGEVIGDGMSVVDEIAAIPTQNQAQSNGAFNEIPLVDYNGDNFPIDAVRDNFAIVNSVTVQSTGGGGGGAEGLSFSVVNNTNTALVSTAIVDGNLTLTYAPGQTGTATITVQATDQFGLSVQTTFTVTVG